MCSFYTDSPVMLRHSLPTDKRAVGLFTSAKNLFQAQQELAKQLSILPRDNYNLLSYTCR